MEISMIKSKGGEVYAEHRRGDSLHPHNLKKTLGYMLGVFFVYENSNDKEKGFNVC